MRRWFAVMIMCLSCCGLMHPACACQKYGESVFVSFAHRRSTIDFDRLKLFFFLKENEPNELRYRSVADNDLVVIIARFPLENAKKQTIWAYELSIRPRSYQDRAMHDFRNAVRVEFERLMKNGLLINFTSSDLNAILSLESFGDMVFYKGEAGIGWQSSLTEGACGGPVELEGDIPTLALPL
ncbi:MAG TPA: hypothetical protein PKL77_05560 [Candidatus Omnitrophota bacterium]|nr:hypothetical protein [Candidatus Omnitrophota bacterium]